jgi:hypothetical protein
MFEEISILLVVICTSPLTAAFAYYNIKYRRFIKENST